MPAHLRHGWQRLPHRHPQLPLDQVQASDLLGDGMLDLEARVHLQKVERALLHQELDRAGVHIADSPPALEGGGVQAGPQVRREVRGRRLLQHLLVAALQRAITVAQHHQAPGRVPEDLHLDVSRAVEIALGQQLPRAEGALRLAPRRLDGARQLVGGANQAHPAPAAPGGGLDQQRESQGGGLLDRAPGQRRHAPLPHQLAGGQLVSHRGNADRGRPHPGQP